MSKRKSISKKTRFEVFKRDSYKCQYCGRSAPEVVLHLDHIQPVSKDGDESLLNYLTACQDCNAGKGARLLSDRSEITKQKDQLDELQERREQIEMMLEWRNALKSLDDDVVQTAVDAADATTPGWSTNDAGRKEIAKLVKTFGLETVLKAINTAAEQYIEIKTDGTATEGSVHLAASKIPGICRWSTQPDDDIRRLYYVRGILRNRLPYLNEWKTLELLKHAHSEGVSVDDLEYGAKTADNWPYFQSYVSQMVKYAREDRRGK